MEHDDVFMRFFFQTLKGYVRKWFIELLVAYIDSWQALEYAFMKHWGEKRDSLYYLTKLNSLKNKSNESIVDFNRRFDKLYNKIPREINHLQQTTNFTYVGAFDAYFPMELREGRAPRWMIM